MKDIVSKGIIFLTGGVIGSVIAWAVVKTKYERTIEDKNEEIAFLRDRYSGNKPSKKVPEIIGKGLAEGIENPDEMTVQKIRDKVQELGYINEQVMAEKEKEEDEEDVEKPYVIAPEETWEQEYPTITLTYYEGNNVLADDHDKIIGNVAELVGEDFAEHFGEYEDNCVYVRNDAMGVYYEILKDYGSHPEI